MTNELERLERARPSMESPADHVRAAAQARLAEAVARETRSPVDPAAPDPRRHERRASRKLGKVALLAGTLPVLLVVIAAFALLGHSQRGGTGRSASAGAGVADARHARALRAQSQKLYAPVVVFERSTTQTERAAIRNAANFTARRIDACQGPYINRLLGGRIGSARDKLDSLYQHGGLMEQYQSEVAVVASQLRIAERSWAAMRLANPIMQRFAHALAAEFAASLNAPRFDACAFVRQIAAHGYSLQWAESSKYGKSAIRWWAQISSAGNNASPFWTYIQSREAQPMRLLTKSQQISLANLPGEIS